MWSLPLGLSRERRHYPDSLSPDISPDGASIAYVAEREGSFDGSSDIVVSSLDGSRYRRLTKDGAVYAHPRWSPDGREIAFISNRSATYGRKSLHHLHVMESRAIRLAWASRSIRELAPSVEISGHPPAWSPDGSRIAFVGYERVRTGDLEYRDRHTVYTVRPDGSDLVELGETLGNPAWSPDGSRIAFIGAGADDGVELYTVSPDGSDRQRLRTLSDADSDWWYAGLSWSPNGSAIIYGLGKGFELITADGDLVTFVDAPNSGESTGGAAWSPDGSRIAFYVPDEHATDVLFTTAHDGSGKRVLVSGRGSSLAVGNIGRH